MMEHKTIIYRGARLTIEQYNALWKAQGGVCASCGNSETVVYKGTIAAYKGGKRELSVDHCHTTGKVRGLLCGNCNRALGLLQEDTERIKKLLQYVEERCIQHYDTDSEIAKHYVAGRIEPGETDDLY